MGVNQRQAAPVITQTGKLPGEIGLIHVQHRGNRFCLALREPDLTGMTATIPALPALKLTIHSGDNYTPTSTTLGS